ncbi:MAG: discoidin domain-containing protein [Armatimonadetes bacterium]|nr:discoidin domain-containing protein [Armatimonadota bacterium]
MPRGRGGCRALWLLLCAVCGATAADQALIEADWQRQAEALDVWRRGDLHLGPVTTADDAAGAVDGVRDGKYAFHCGLEPNPWWQVDLGQSRALRRVVVYNRLDYAPGLHNADTLRLLTSDDGRAWTLCHDQAGQHFGGISGAPPLSVTFAPGSVSARYVRLTIPSPTPIYFHLDEVEVYGEADPATNLALGQPADQSSLSQWSVVKPKPRRAGEPFVYATAEVLARGLKLAADLGATADAQALRALSTAGDRESYLAARRAVRRLAFANPRLPRRLLFCKRFTQQTYPDICLNHMPWVSRPGGDLCVLEDAFGERPTVRPLLNGRLGPGHVHGLDLSYDGRRIVFGYARSKTADPPLLPWPPAPGTCRANVHLGLRARVEPTHIYEIGADGSGLRQITNHPYWSDLDPTWLPNGEIAFVSERCGTSLQCNHDPSLDETSCNLYVMGADGGRLRRLSANKDGDYLPHTLDDGTIGYTRWEYQERNLTQIQSLWYVRPDGTGADALFKQHLDNPWALEDVRSLPGAPGRFVAIAAGHHTLAAGPIVTIEPGLGLNEPRSLGIVTPGCTPPEGGMSGQPVPEGGVLDDGGHYMTPWPLSDRQFLAAYSYQKTWPAGAPEHYRGNDETGYALYLVDVYGNKELIYRDPAISCSAPIPLAPRPRPPVLADSTDPTDAWATCTLTSAAFGSDGIEAGRARYLRISRGVEWPYDQRFGGLRYESVALSAGLGWTPVQVLGTVPIEADGSAHFRVPADMPVYFQLLDADKMELRRMRSFISFQPGEKRGCFGCHETRAKAPAQAAGLLALRREPSLPTPPPWGTRAVNFLRDVQPVLDRQCTKCHVGLKPAAGLDLGGGLVGGLRFKTRYGGELGLDGTNTAYRSLITGDQVAYSNKWDPASAVTPPLAFGSHRSRLVAALRDGPCAKRASLSADDWLRLVTWIDANAPYHSHFINTRPTRPAYDLAVDRDLAAALGTVHQRRCTPCHQPADVTRLDWIDLREPRASLFLRAALSGAGGDHRCARPPYADDQDADYQAVAALVSAAVARAWAAPRRDLLGLLPEDTSPEGRAVAGHLAGLPPTR